MGSMEAHKMPAPLETGFSYNTFIEWYETMERQRWRPAEVTITRLLNEHLDRELSDFTRKRIQVTTSRVKDAARTWKKLGREKYRGKFAQLDDVSDVIDDIVGIRITCNNLSDVEYLVSTLGGLPYLEDASDVPLAVLQGKDADYLSTPKESGYRAYHVNLCVRVPGVTEMHAIPVELQIRTRLQDSWGELTHEDTYKPEMELPEIVEPLARRMADLLAVVDNIAQDIRDELDRQMAALDQAVMEGDSLAESGAGAPEVRDQERAKSIEKRSSTPEVSQEVLQSELRRMVSDLTKPAAMAELAQGLISLFGPDIARDWGGFRTFKDLLASSTPDALITNVGPSYVAPPSLTIPDIYLRPMARTQDETSTPEVVLQLKSVDTKVPTTSGVALGQFLLALKHAFEFDTWRGLGVADTPPRLGTVNLLARDARNIAQEDGQLVSRQNLDWALKAFLWSGNLRPGWQVDDIVEILTHWILSRAASQGIPVDPVETGEAVREWFVEGVAQATR